MEQTRKIVLFSVRSQADLMLANNAVADQGDDSAPPPQLAKIVKKDGWQTCRLIFLASPLSEVFGFATVMASLFYFRKSGDANVFSHSHVGHSWGTLSVTHRNCNNDNMRP